MTIESRLNEIEHKAKQIPSCMIGLQDVNDLVRALKIAMRLIDILLETPNTRALAARREIAFILGAE